MGAVLNGINAILNINSSQLKEGRVGLAFALSPLQTVARGTKIFLQLSFAILVASPEETTLSFSDQPIARQIVDAAAHELPASYANLSLVVQTPPDAYDSWKVTHFTAAELANPAISSETADPDADGARNRDEFLAGTDPRDTQSVLRVSMDPPGHVTWKSVPGRIYRISRKSGLADSEWIPLSPLIIATGSPDSAEFVDFEFTTQAFYRVEVIP